MKSVIMARSNLMLEFHVPADKLETMISLMPAMKRPTVAKLASDEAYAIKIVVKKESFGDLLHLIKENGGSDVIVTQPVYVVP
jgi:ATP phosphoribosyltransferase